MRIPTYEEYLQIVAQNGTEEYVSKEEYEEIIEMMKEE